jgi:hypothetical protein
MAALLCVAGEKGCQYQIKALSKQRDLLKNFSLTINIQKEIDLNWLGS